MARETIDAAAAGTFAVGDLTVRRMGFGAMRITGPGIWGPPRDRANAIAVLRRAVALGIDFIDTADSYGPNVSEELIAEALHPYPDGLVIATKGGLVRGGPNDWRADGRPEHLREALEGSLRRLRLETIDLYQFHRPDPAVPFEESVGALAELQRAGKIRHLGLSNVSVDELRRAQMIAPIVSVQNRYNLDDLRSDDVVDVCAEEGIAFLPWAPVNAGDTASHKVLVEIASARGATATQIALAWLLQRSPAMIPIPGTASIAHLEENVAAAGIRLSESEVARLEE